MTSHAYLPDSSMTFDNASGTWVPERRVAMSADAVISYTDEETELVFRWHGGAYIDVGTVQAIGAEGIDGDDFHAFDVINVWDDERDCSRFELAADITAHMGRPFRRVLEYFEDTCREYIDASREDEEA